MALHTLFEIKVILFNSRVFQVTKISGKDLSIRDLLLLYKLIIG
jgi:hypothetical protein